MKIGKIIVLIGLALIALTGCGRLDTTSAPNETPPKTGNDGSVITSNPVIVNANPIGDQKNCNLTRLNANTIIVVFIDETTFKIKAAWYNNKPEKLMEKTLYTEHPILDGRPGITAFNDGFIVSWESFDGEYIAYYDSDGIRRINDTKILESGKDDTMVLAISTVDIMIVYESNQPNNGNKDVYSQVIRFK